MLDYSLVKAMVKQALEELQPLKVEVAAPKTSHKTTLRDIILSADPPFDVAASPDPGKQWEIFSGVITHITGVNNTLLGLYDEAGRWFFVQTVAAASPTALYALDLLSSKLIVTGADGAELESWNAGDAVVLRVLETNV